SLRRRRVRRDDHGGGGADAFCCNASGNCSAYVESGKDRSGQDTARGISTRPRRTLKKSDIIGDVMHATGHGHRYGGGGNAKSGGGLRSNSAGSAPGRGGVAADRAPGTGIRGCL